MGKAISSNVQMNASKSQPSLILIISGRAENAGQKRIMMTKVGKGGEVSERGVYIMESKYNVSNISKYIISKCNYEKKIITNLYLQKILYYVQGYFLKKYNMLAFDSDIEAWQYGPAIPDSYYEYCANSTKPIVFAGNEIDDYLDGISKKKHKRLIDDIIEKCMSLFTTSLVNKTCCETPWSQTGNRDIIDVKIMAAYFINNDPLELGA